jgi:putative ABC transport system permease protein
LTIVGIVPASFQILFSSDIWTPFPPRRTPEQRRQHYLQVIARLRPGATIDQARSDMDVVAQNIARISPETNKGWGVTIEPLRNALVSGEVRSTSLVLGGVVAFVLLMACANVANLLLARGIGRAREMAVRAALGASSRHLARLLLTESVVLALPGGAAGLALSWIALRVAPAIVPPGLMPEGIPLQFDIRVALFAAALTCLTGVLFGMAPAWHAARTPLGESLAAGGRASIGGVGRLRAVLAVGEIRRRAAAGGRRTSHSHPRGRVCGGSGVSRRFSPDHEREPAAQPLCQSEECPDVLPPCRSGARGDSGRPVGRIRGHLPLDGWDIGQGIEIVGGPPIDASNRKSAHYQITTPRYFETIGIRLAKGRAFTDRDIETSPPVCIVNEEFVRRFLDGGEPLGAIVKVANMAPGNAPTIPREIVGVIRQVAIGAGEKDKAPEIYVPMEQNVWYASSIALKTAGPPVAYTAAARAAIESIDKDQPVTRVRTMDEVAAEATQGQRFRAALVSTFAGIALVLAAVGIFGVLTFSVRERTRELGVRVALGATSTDILRLVVGSALKIAVSGVVIGLAAAAVLTRTLASLLFGVTPLDPVTFVAAPAVLVTTTLVASVAPAIRAIGVDPAVTLRQE